MTTMVIGSSIFQSFMEIAISMWQSLWEFSMGLKLC
ncbi:hypothetical protein Golob_026618, partial [Gossypium lobatum]|nr:hypothetical protein [Gossypium lobatum]